MTQLQSIFLTAALTLLGGTIILILGEFTKVLVILPLQKFKEQIQLTLDRVDFYSNRICNHFPAKPSDKEKALISQMENDLRSAATQLSSKYAVISLKKLLVAVHVLPSGTCINDAYTALIYLHNSTLYTSTVDEHNNTRANSSKIDIVKAALTQF